ncbi:hypothetical protein [Halomicrobium katesii]|uniref:hypothetical protein n=1 Tax=Halomicrobium katesii TaxID=437163 RepID=UPI0003708170|nr:hypothetical protein [Halomicrobium katesii]
MSDSDGGLTDYLNEQEGDSTFSVNGTEYTLVDTNNPVNWARVGTAITLSGIATISVIFQEFVDTWFGGIEDIIRGAASWVGEVNPESASGSGVLGELFVPLLRWYREGLWEASLETFGVFGYLVAVGITLVSIGIVVIGFRRAGQRLAGGR